MHALFFCFLTEKLEVAACHGGIPTGFHAPLPKKSEKMEVAACHGGKPHGILIPPPPPPQKKQENNPCPWILLPERLWALTLWRSQTHLLAAALIMHPRHSPKRRVLIFRQGVIVKLFFETRMQFIARVTSTNYSPWAG